MHHQSTAVISSTLLSPEEELANRITHGIGLLLSIAGVAVMIAVLGRGDDGWRIAGCSVYLSSLISVYLMSTLSHTFETPRLRSLFRALDQGTIYLLIAATYTPFSMAYLHTVPWWIVLALVWGIALWGFISKVCFAYRVEEVSMWPCIVLGMIPFVCVPSLVGVVSLAALWWMLLGVAFYTLGLVFWVNDRRVRHFHAVWHVLVMAGSTCHFVGILMFVVLAR
ncbi:MAG TPA: hemolysin III family protein [Lacipirellulaceae bacterium]|nr:hemolysin III family protein [Lacipirellulaceae bacterium]